MSSRTAVKSKQPRLQAPPPDPARRRGLSRKEFAEANDYNTRTRLAIRRLVKTLKADEILKDGEFRAECGVAANHGWRVIAEEAEFLPYQFRLGDRDYFWAAAPTVDWACKHVAKARRIDP